MLNRIIRLIGLFFFGLAFWLVAKEVERVGLSHLITIITETPWWVIGLASIFILLDYIVLSGYDVTALDYIGKKLPFATVFKTSALGFAISNTVGHSFASGGAIRYLFYTPQGLSRHNILILIAFETLTLYIGMGLIYLIAIILSLFIPNILAHFETFYIAAGFVSIIFLIYFFAIVYPKHTLKIKNTFFKAPSFKITSMQCFIGVVDNFLVSIVFYCILRYYVETSFLPVFIIFTIAQITAQFSQVPGGLGVLSTLFILLFPHTLSQKAGILAGLFVFRFLYFFVPLIISSFYLIFHIIYNQITQKNCLNADKKNLY